MFLRAEQDFVYSTPNQLRLKPQSGVELGSDSIRAFKNYK